MCFCFRYVESLEQVVIDLLSFSYNLHGFRSPHTGVWVKTRGPHQMSKICALGVIRSSPWKKFQCKLIGRCTTVTWSQAMVWPSIAPQTCPGLIRLFPVAFRYCWLACEETDMTKITRVLGLRLWPRWYRERMFLWIQLGKSWLDTLRRLSIVNLVIWKMKRE